MEVFQSGPLCDRTMAGPLIPDDAQIRIFSAEANGGAGQDDNDVANPAACGTHGQGSDGLTSAPADAAQTAPPVPDLTAFGKTQGSG